VIPGDAIFDARGHAISPLCHGPVSEPFQAGEFNVRRHLERLDNGELCPYGRGQGDPIPQPAGAKDQ
jgi:hypothetical protein